MRFQRDDRRDAVVTDECLDRLALVTLVEKANLKRRDEITVDNSVIAIHQDG